jgi:hypothetical protein
MTKTDTQAKPKVPTPVKATALQPAAQVKESGRSLEIKQIFASLPEKIGIKLVPYYTSGVKLLNSSYDSLIQSRYDMGQLLGRVQAEFGTNGELATSALARAWGHGRSETSYMLNVAQKIREDELALFKSLAGPTGRKLSWMHLVALAAVDNKNSRRALAQRAAREDLSYDELVDVIRAGRADADEDEGNHGGGRPFKIPKALEAFVDKSERQVSSTLKYMQDVVLPHLKAKVEETPRDKITPKTLARMQALSESFADLQAKIEQGAAQLHVEIAILAKDLGVEAMLPARPASEDIVVESPAAAARPSRRKVAIGKKHAGVVAEPKRRK